MNKTTIHSNNRSARRWIVFFDGIGKELLRITEDDSFETEISSSICLLAYENNISPDEISFAIIGE